MVPQIAPYPRAAPEARPAQGQQHQHEMAQIDGVELAQPAVIERPARRQVRCGRSGCRSSCRSSLDDGLAPGRGRYRSQQAVLPLVAPRNLSCCNAASIEIGSLRNPSQAATMTETRQAREIGPQGSALADPHLCRPFDGGQVERALSHQPGARADRPVGRLRSADPDRLRLRPSAGQGRGRQGRRADQPSRRHAHPVRRHPARPHEHLDDHQRAGGVAAVSLYRGGRGRGRRARQAAGHDAERHHQGISLARDLHLPARAVAPADRRHDRLHLSRGSQVEPDERLQLSPAGSGRDAGAGAGLLARQRHRRARRGARARPGARGGFPAGRRPHLVLRQCRHPLRHRDVQDASVRRIVGRHHAQPLRRRRSPSSGCSATACR